MGINTTDNYHLNVSMRQLTINRGLTDFGSSFWEWGFGDQQGTQYPFWVTVIGEVNEMPLLYFTELDSLLHKLVIYQ